MDTQGQTDELYPIAVLIDELKHDDVLLRLNAIHRLSTIALALGAERTRDELIPFLDESVEDEDEVLTALSEELGNFVEYVGGPEHGHVLLSPLENLAAIEEPLVREKAVESLNKICKELSQQQVEEHFIPLVVRLSKADWFTSKISATGLYDVPYAAATPPSQEGLRQHFGQLVHDDTPMVRRQAATNLSKFVKEMPATIVIEEMIPLFQHLSGDDQDSVRLLTVEILIAIAEVVPKEQQSSHGVLLSALRSLFEDKSWRVRYMVADRFEKIAKAVDEEVVSRDLVPAFVKLLKDTEAEVRSAIAGQIPGFCNLVERDTLLNEIMPAVEELVTDSSQHVRAALGSQISGLAPILGKEETINHLLPMFLQMLKDDFPDVRLNIISKLESVNNVIGVEKLSSSLLPAITNLAEDKQWRVRLAIIEYVPLLASQLGVKFFDEKLNSLCMSWLGDTVFSIREASTQNLRKLAEVFGVEWANKAIIPQVSKMSKHPNYLYRMTTCFAISTLVPVLNLSVIESDIVKILKELVNDEIPNIRFNVAKSYGVLIDVLKRIGEEGSLVELEKKGEQGSVTAKGNELIQEQILPDLRQLQNDDDVDVRFFAVTSAQKAADGDTEEMQMMATVAQRIALRGEDAIAPRLVQGPYVKHVQALNPAMSPMGFETCDYHNMFRITTLGPIVTKIEHDMSTNVLTPQQAHALLDILSHNEVYQEIQDFRAPGTLGTYGAPFNNVSPSTSPALQALVTRFATTVPGLRDINPQFWHTQVEPIIENFEQAELSESYDKGHLGIRKTLATALSALLEYPVRGIFAGFDEPKPEDRNRKYDTTSSEDLQLACRDFLHEVVYSDLLDSMVEKAATTDQLSDHRPIVQAAHEYGLVNLASFLHYVLIISPKGQHILNMVDHANKLVPYMIIRQTLKIGNVASMISAMMRVVLAKVSMASVTNWVGWTKDANEGMNLMQTIVSTVLQFDMKEFKSKANKIEKDKKCPSKEHLKALNAYAEMSREEHERIRAASEKEGKSIVAAIFEAASIKGKLTDEQHTQSLEYLAMKLSVRDREQITNVLCRSNPDHLTQIVRDVVGTYEPIIRHVHKAVNLSETVLDFEYFLKDLIKLAKIPSQTAASGSYLALHKHKSSQESTKNRPSPATVGDFVFLLKRHQYSFHRFLHQCAKNGKELTSMFVDYAKAACAHFRKSSSSSAPGVPAPSMYSSKADAGELADPLRDLFAQLPEAKQKELIPILEAHNSYIDALHESSSLRLRAVLASPRSNHPIFQTPSHHQQSQPPSQTISRSGSPEPKPTSMQSSPALGPMRSADSSLAMIDPGPGAFLARWQALLDATAITPASPQGAVRRGMNPSVLDASRTEPGLQPISSTSQLSHSSTADSSTSSKGASAESASAGHDADDGEDDDDEFHDAVEKVMEIHVAGSDKVIKISRPDTTPVIQALEPQFRALLGMVSVEKKSDA